MDFNTVLISIQNKLPRDGGISGITLKENFNKLSEDKKRQAIDKIVLLNLKNPALVFWVGSFFFGTFGVGRFMIGDTLLGFIRLVIQLIVMFLQVVIDVPEDVPLVVRGFGAILLFINFIWWIVDLFLVGKKLRSQNFAKVHAIFKEL